MLHTATWIVLLFLPLVLPARVSAQSASDMLVTTDIASFKASKRPFCGSGPGILAGADHFDLDHTDTACGISYFDLSTRLGVKVEVTLHSSSQWLGHEVEDGFRDSDVLEASWTKGARVREIDGQKIFGVRGSGYTWISGTSTVVNITYTDLTGTKPEPIEIIQAYLAKYPSSIALSNDEAKSPSHTESWLKNEMERRVWLMEKWVSVGSADVLKQAEAMRTILTHVEVFARYRQKYLGEDPKDLMVAFYAAAGGGGGSITPENWLKLTAEVAKLRAWWDSNKTRPLLISGVPSGFRLAEGWPVLLGGLGAARQLWVNRGRVTGAIGRWFTKER